MRRRTLALKSLSSAKEDGFRSEKPHLSPGLTKIAAATLLSVLIVFAGFREKRASLRGQTRGLCANHGTAQRKIKRLHDDDTLLRDINYSAYGCNEINKNVQPIHNQSTWMLLRGVYQGVVGQSLSSITPLSFGNGFSVPFYVNQSHHESRGIFSSKPIQKGEHVWKASSQSAQFKDRNLYRTFLSSLPDDLVCDILQWTHVELLDDNTDSVMIFVHLDDGSYCNDGGGKASVGCDPEAAKQQPGGCKLNYFAERDIAAGEELLCSYGESTVGGWGCEELDAGNGKAVDKVRKPKKEKWHDFTRDDLWKYIGCKEIYETESKMYHEERPSFNQSELMLIRGVYQGVVGPTQSSITPLSHGHGYAVDIAIKHSPGKGRGVFTNKPIKKGELIWNPGNDQAAYFKDGYTYRRFRVSIPAAISCQLHYWAEVYDIDGDGNYTISLDTDEGGYMNDGGSKFANIGCNSEIEKQIPGGCEMNDLALRDIDAGEELLMNYNAGHHHHSAWKIFGLEK